MTDFMESVRPVEPLTPIESGTSTALGGLSVRQLLAELAHLEDVVRAGTVDDPDVLAAMAREQVIIDELHRRNP